MLQQIISFFTIDLDQALANVFVTHPGAAVSSLSILVAWKVDDKMPVTWEILLWFLGMVILIIPFPGQPVDEASLSASMLLGQLAVNRAVTRLKG